MPRGRKSARSVSRASILVAVRAKDHAAAAAAAAIKARAAAAAADAKARAAQFAVVAATANAAKARCATVAAAMTVFYLHQRIRAGCTTYSCASERDVFSSLIENPPDCSESHQRVPAGFQYICTARGQEQDYSEQQEQEQEQHYSEHQQVYSEHQQDYSEHHYSKHHYSEHQQQEHYDEQEQAVHVYLSRSGDKLWAGGILFDTHAAAAAAAAMALRHLVDNGWVWVTGFSTSAAADATKAGKKYRRLHLTGSDSTCAQFEKTGFTCAHCGELGARMRCGLCLKTPDSVFHAVYCGRECQKEHWKKHCKATHCN